MISGLEGALALARGVRSLEPFEQAAAELRNLIVSAIANDADDAR